MNFEEYFDNDTIQIENTILASDLSKIDTNLPSTIHIIPVRYRPIFPGIITPLIIAKPRFMRSIDEALNTSRAIGLAVLKDDDVEDVEIDDIEMFGTAAKIIKKINLPDESINVLINSICRFRITKIVDDKKSIIAKVEYIYDRANPKNLEIKALTRAILSQLKILSESNPLFTEEMKLTMLNVDEPGRIADFVTSILNLEKQEYQNILETINVKKRLEKVLVLLQKELEVVSVQRKIQNQINEKVYKQQRDYFLREQLKIIKQELGLDDDRSNEIQQMKSKIETLNLKGEPKEKIQDELNRLYYIESNTPEYIIARTYLDTVLSLPWNTYTEDCLDITRAEKILKKSHYGLDDVKERIIEFLSVRMLKSDSAGSILCLVGPPGVGKTSLGQAIADSLKRTFFRVSLGGIRDEAEIKGHRRTYIGAMPGKIIQGLKICKSKNPVFMLDEIDKLYQSYQGDPAASLLEVLDYEQNHSFRDHYIDMPFDLSKVLFITTANTTDTIPDVLLDRMEVIRIPGYIAEEKYHIAKHFLLPKQLKKHGLPKNSIELDKNALFYIINGWAREAGVRNLDRQLERLCRKKAKSIVKNDDSFPHHLDKESIRSLLGPEHYTGDTIPDKLKPGIAIGLAWTSTGGSVLLIEALSTPTQGSSTLTLTGNIGDVMKESATIAYNYIKNYFNGDTHAIDFFNKNNIHIHVPAGAIPKDGPSAGITMASALYSLVKDKPVTKRIAMTGELTLSGRVLPVGGIKEKLIAAKREHCNTVIMPMENKKEMGDIPSHITKGLSIYFIAHIDEVFDIVFM